MIKLRTTGIRADDDDVNTAEVIILRFMRGQTIMQGDQLVIENLA